MGFICWRHGWFRRIGCAFEIPRLNSMSGPGFFRKGAVVGRFTAAWSVCLPVFHIPRKPQAFKRSSFLGKFLSNPRSSPLPKDRLGPVVGKRVPHQNRPQEKGYPYSNLSTGGPSRLARRNPDSDRPASSLQAYHDDFHLHAAGGSRVLLQCLGRLGAKQHIPRVCRVSF